MNADTTTKATRKGGTGTAPLAAALLLVLAVLPARAVRAQYPYHVVERDVLTERFHRDLSDVLDGASRDGHSYGLEPGSVRFSYPESSGWAGAAFATLGAGAVLYAVAPVAAAAIAAPSVSAGVAAAAKGMSILQWHILVSGTFLSSYSFALVFVGGDYLEADGLMSFQEVPSRSFGGLRDFFFNRLEVHYSLTHPYGGRTENGSCLAFFSLVEYDDGGRGLHYALDACTHDEAFPQLVRTWTGDPRIGSDGVDEWDWLMGQSRVVAKGSVPIP